MILNNPQMSALIIPFAGLLDLDEVSRLKARVAEAGTRRLVVVIDCTAMSRFTDEALDDLLALRRYVERQGIGKIMVAIRQPSRFGGTLTRLIPASLRILLVQLPRYVSVA